jgi:hypothetical protein
MTPEQQAALAARLAQQEMLALSDAQAADALNAAGSGVGVTWQDFASADLYVVLLEAGVWGLIELNSRRAPTTALATAGSAPNAQDVTIGRLIMLVRMVQDIPTIHASRAGVRATLAAIFNGIGTAGFLTTDVRDACIALAQRPATWAEAAGWSRAITSRDVGRARGSKP